jgi:tetratricopeptide (TPR) repeat protein
MILTETFRQWINQPTPAALAGAFGVAIVLLVIAGVLLLLGGRWKWLALAMGIVGVVATLAVLVVVDQQTVRYRESESVTVTRPRYNERIRTLVRGAMICVPGAVALVALGAWASARRLLRLSVPSHIRAGRMHLLARDYGPALAEFNRAIRISPYLAEAHCGRGAAFEGLGDVSRALAEYDQAIQFDPRLGLAFIKRAHIRTEAGDLDGALSDLSRVMDLQPTDPELYLQRGICYFKKGLAMEAAADLHRVLKLTNHTDFAEPAKDYLHRLETRTLDAPHPSSLPPPPLAAAQANGATDSTVVPEPKTEDYIL